MEYSDSCITTMKACCEKSGHYGKQTYIVDIGKVVSL